MSLATKLRYSLARMLFKASGYAVVPQWVRSSFLVPTFDNLIREGYNKNAVVIGCMSVLTFTFPEPPLMVWSDESERGKRLPDHPLRKLLRRPNPLMGEDELMQYTMAWAAIGGNAFWLTAKDRQGRAAEQSTYPYHAGQVRVIPGGPEWVKGYEFFNAQQEWEEIDQDQYIVTHFKWPLPDPAQPWQAQPPLRAVASAVDTDSEIDTYLYALLKNDAVVRTLVKLPKGFEMTKPEKDRFRSQWADMYGGTNRGGVAILDDGASVERLGLNLQELAFEALRKVPEARIASALRVPPILAGLNVGLDSSTYNNLEGLQLHYTKRTLVPLWRAWGAEVESSLGDGNVSIRYDLTKVAALQEDTDALWARVNRAWMGGYMTLNEARRAIGYEDVPGGDVYYIDPKRLLVPAPQMGAADMLQLPERAPTPAGGV